LGRLSDPGGSFRIATPLLWAAMPETIPAKYPDAVLHERGRCHLGCRRASRVKQLRTKRSPFRSFCEHYGFETDAPEQPTRLKKNFGDALTAAIKQRRETAARVTAIVRTGRRRDLGNSQQLLIDKIRTGLD
jgi:hypothetical protein